MYEFSRTEILCNTTAVGIKPIYVEPPNVLHVYGDNLQKGSYFKWVRTAQKWNISIR